MNKLFLFCRVSVSPVRSEEKDSSEMVTQFLFGELALLIEQSEKWLKVQSLEDDYIGYVDPKQFIVISELEKENWKIGRKRYFQSVTLKMPRETMILPSGCFVKSNFSINNQLYSIQKEEQFFSDWKHYALHFLNTPYLWGGRSTFGIDCSGFTQQIMRFRKIELPRDASQQVSVGQKIAFEQRQIGDLLFFRNSNNKITHVGIVIDTYKIIHASGFVKIDTFTKDGIICAETGVLTHQLNCVVRYY